ncbi:MAG: dihydropteroate synthase [Muribaculaceae bacterium]|nr:dihydropteroate synthase [Muribaculaceae bacterium]
MISRFKPFSLNIRGRLLRYERPAVMGIINATPDSFFAPSRALDSEAIAEKAAEMIAEGVDIIDVGAYSTRPGATAVSAGEELERLRMAIVAVRSVDSVIPVSVDTFRADIARLAVTEMGADIINDISGGEFDSGMFDVAAITHAPYILTHNPGTEGNMHPACQYGDVVADVLRWLSGRLRRLALAGVNDVIVDPGFGFGKTIEDNYRLMASLPLFEALDRPLLVGISRKSMIYKQLGVDPTDAQDGTTALNTVALLNGASIIRVHDVKAAAQTVRLIQLIDSTTKADN